METKNAAPAEKVKDESALLDAKRKPIKVFREDAVSVAVWARDREVRGEKLTFFTMTFQKRWFDEKEKAHYTDSFELSDMASLMRLAKLAQDYVEPLLYPELHKQDAPAAPKA